MARRTKTTSPFDIGQIRTFVKRAQERVGGKQAWEFVGPAVRRMAVQAEAFGVMAAQIDSARFGADDLRAVAFDMGVEAGTIEIES